MSKRRETLSLIALLLTFPHGWSQAHALDETISRKPELRLLSRSLAQLTGCYGTRQNGAAFDACINRYTPRDLSDAEARNIAEFVILDLKSISLEPCPAQAQIQQRFKFKGPYACFEVKHRAGPSTLGLVEFSLVKGGAEPKIRSIRMSF